MTCSERVAAAVLAALLATGCGGKKAPPPSPAPPLAAYDAGKALHPQFSGAKAMEWAEKIVAFGPRPSGSDALEKTRAYFEGELRKLGWETQRQTFQDTTPRGTLTFVNVRARFPGGDTWERTTPVVVASHYDTKFYKDITFVGANDGASGNAVMLEMARVLAAEPELARRMEFVFFDGEEATVDFTPLDGLHGSRHYAQWIRSLERARRPQRGLVLDMVGDKDLFVGMPPNSSSALRNLALQAAREAGAAAHFGTYQSEILDDHVPLMHAGLDMANFIDLQFPAWHTAGDTLDKISAESMGTVGKVAVLFLEKYVRP